MGRELPAGLSDAQRMALSEFYAGHISAGQLSQRLGLAPPTSTDGSSQRQSPVWEVPPNGAAPGRGGPTARTIEGLVPLMPTRTAT